MSFDIFVIAPGKGFDRSIADRVFTFDPSLGPWALRDADGDLCHIEPTIDDGPLVNSIGINRPPWVDIFWDAMFDLLRETPTFLAWPAGGPKPTYCVVNPDWRSYIEPGFIEYMGPPAIVASGAEIPEIIERSFG